MDPTCEGVTSIVHVQQRDPTEEMWTLTSSYMQRESPVPVCNPTGSVRDLCTWQEKDSSSIQQLPVSAVFILIIELTKAMYRRKINLVKAYYKGMCPTRRWFIYQIFWYDYTHYLLYTCLIIFPSSRKRKVPASLNIFSPTTSKGTPCDLSLSIRVTKKRRKIAVAKTASLQHSGSNLNHGLWVDMYRPLTCEQVCGNSVGAEELRGWLCSHQGKRNKFEEEPTNALLLLGPPGCGKDCCCVCCGCSVRHQCEYTFTLTNTHTPSHILCLYLDTPSHLHVCLHPLRIITHLYHLYNMCIHAHTPSHIHTNSLTRILHSYPLFLSL